MVAHYEHATTAESELECAAVTVEFDARGPIEESIGFRVFTDLNQGVR